jgi:hypothetical protein
MTPELQKALAEWLQATLGILQTVGTQIPPMLWERVLWGRIVLTFALVAVSVSGAVGFCAMRRAALVKPTEHELYEWSPRSVHVAWAYGVLVCSQGFAWLLVGPEAAMAWFAPRVYLLNWLRGLL